MKKYVFKPYNKKFPALFEAEKKRIASQVKNKLIIEHIGSTAIPNLGGKGIIDIAIAAEKSELESISEQLQKMGYEFRAPHSTPEKLYFRADLPDREEGIRRYHIHLMPHGSEDWKGFIAFRDYLRNHPDEAEKYAALKKQAASDAEEDGKKYRAQKDPLIQDILKKSFKVD